MAKRPADPVSLDTEPAAKKPANQHCSPAAEFVMDRLTQTPSLFLAAPYSADDVYAWYEGFVGVDGDIQVMLRHADFNKGAPFSIPDPISIAQWLCAETNHTWSALYKRAGRSKKRMAKRSHCGFLWSRATEAGFTQAQIDLRHAARVAEPWMTNTMLDNLEMRPRHLATLMADPRKMKIPMYGRWSLPYPLVGQQGQPIKISRIVTLMDDDDEVDSDADD